MLTPDEKLKINNALTVNNGDRALAADALNIEQRKLTAIINKCPDLKALWARQRKPLFPEKAADTGDVVKLLPIESDEQTAARRELEFKKLMRCVGEDGEMEQSFSLLRAYHRYSEECESLLAGNLVEQAIRLHALLKRLDEDIKKELEQPVLSPGFASKSILYCESQRQLSRITETVGAIRLARAKIMQMKADARSDKNRGKTSFGPKTTNVFAQNAQLNG